MSEPDMAKGFLLVLAFLVWVGVMAAVASVVVHFIVKFW